MIKIAPSLLAADFSVLKDEIKNVEDAGCDMLHLDVMDGHFVPNLTIGPFIVKAIRGITKLPLDAHLMIEKPWEYLQAFAESGANHITVHAEACGDKLSETILKIKDLGCTAGVSLKPKTELREIRGSLDMIDMILLMTVNPGFGGQAFMPEVLPKITELRQIYDKDIEVDGGINAETAVDVVKAGANVLVAGTAIFRSKNPKQTIQQLKGIESTVNE